MKTEYRVVFNNGIYTDPANILRTRICEVLNKPDFGDLVILFSSSGGDTYEALSLFSFIVQLPVSVRMHAIGHVGSAAVPVFLAGNDRTGEPLCRFLIHPYDWAFNGSETLNGIKEKALILEHDINTSRKIIKSRTQVPDGALDAIDGKAESALFHATEAVSLGLIDDVVSLGKAGSNGMEVVWISASVRP